MAQLEQAEVLDKLSDNRRGLVEYFVTPGAAAAGLVTLIAPQLRTRATQTRTVWNIRKMNHKTG